MDTDPFRVFLEMQMQLPRNAPGSDVMTRTMFDDGIAMGHDGMLYSLPSRELIADSVELVSLTAPTVKAPSVPRRPIK